MTTSLKAWKKISRQLAGSYVVWALIALLACDGGARVLSSLGAWPVSPQQTAYHSWIWWITSAYSRQKNPDIVLMGSSLMMAALHGGDATYLRQPQKVALHNHSRLLEDLLRTRLHSSLSTFSFALGGEMASDAYVISRTMFSQKQHPRAIIYGIAPRDFMDNALASPASTSVFKQMERLGDLSDIAIRARSSFWSILEYLGTRASFLYGHRPDFIYIQHQLARSLLVSAMNPLHLDLDFAHVHTLFHIRKQAMLELPEDSGPDEVVIHPPTRGSGDEYTDNLAEYRYRYSSFKEKQFAEQLSYLERLLSLSRDYGIEVVLVNMPLTQDNVKIMPQGLYKRYLSRVATLCSKYDARLVDMNEPSDFPKRYFADSVHLNPRGGEHFFELLSGRLLKDSRVASTLRRTSGSL